MSAYIGIFKIKFKSELQYRGKLISGVITQTFWGLMYIYLYTAFMTTKAIDGFTIEQMATYVWLGQSLFVMRYIGINKSAAKEICNGNICYKFVRPIDVYNNWYAEYFGEKLSNTIMRCIPILLISMILPSNIGLMTPVSILALMLSIISIIIGFCLSISISMLSNYLTMKTLNSKGSTLLITTIAGLLGGQFIPLPLLPTGVQKVLEILPFSYVSDLSLRLYIGAFDIKTGLIRIVLAIIWLIIITIIGKLLINSALKKTVVQGG